MPKIREDSHRGSAASRSSDTASRFQPLHRRAIPKSDKGSTTDLSRFSFHSNSREYLTLRDDIVQELKVEDARIVTSYDPRTIARSILTAANKHPTDEGLNHHLEILRKSFREVNIRSDLSTFRWDIVDPCEAPSSSRVDSRRVPTTVSPKENTAGVASHWDKWLFVPPEGRPKHVPLQPPFKDTRQRIESIHHDTSETDLEVTQKRTEFECKWLDCGQVFLEVEDLVSHIRQSHVMGSPTRICNWTNCGKVQPMSTSTLWEHVLKTHVERSMPETNGRNVEGDDVSKPHNCKWESCDASFSDVQDLRAHALNCHVMKGLSGPCDWFNCDCFQPMPPLGLWDHVLSTHLPFFTPQVGDASGKGTSPPKTAWFRV